MAKRRANSSSPTTTTTGDSLVSGSASIATTGRTIALPMEAVTEQRAPNEPRSIRFDLPLPPRELSPNTYRHWRVVSKAKRDYRRDAHLIAVAAMAAQGWKPDPNRHVEISVEFCLKGARLVAGYAPKDEANGLYALKAAIDGIVDAGLVSDDRYPYVTLGRISFNDKEGPEVRITAKEL